MLTFDKAADNYVLKLKILYKSFIYHSILIPLCTEFDHQNLFKCVYL